MQKYTLNLANILYLVLTLTLMVWILIVGKVIIAPLLFAFFLP